MERPPDEEPVVSGSRSSIADEDVIDVVLLEGRRRRRRFIWSMIGLVVLLLASVTVAVTWGSVSVPLGRVWSTVWSHVVHGTGTGGGIDAIVWEIRVPRVLLGLVVGAGLALVGVAVQAMVRNPLADPYVLGVESGAAAAAVAVIYLGRVAALRLPFSPAVAAFVGAMATLALVFALARRHGRVSSTRMLLVGVALSYALSGLTSFFLYASPDPAAQQQLLFWILGSLGGATWSMIPYAMVVLVVAAGVVFVHAQIGRASCRERV